MSDTSDRERAVMRAGNQTSIARGRASRAQIEYLSGGLTQPGGRLPLFDQYGGKIDADVMRACLRDGYCEAWFANPMKPDWLVCRLTDRGRDLFR